MAQRRAAAESARHQRLLEGQPERPLSRAQPGPGVALRACRPGCRNAGALERLRAGGCGGGESALFGSPRGSAGGYGGRRCGSRSGFSSLLLLFTW